MTHRPTGRMGQAALTQASWRTGGVDSPRRFSHPAKTEHFWSSADRIGHFCFGHRVDTKAKTLVTRQDVRYQGESWSEGGYLYDQGRNI